MTNTPDATPETLRELGVLLGGHVRLRKVEIDGVPLTRLLDTHADAWASELARREAAAAPCEWVEDNDGIWNTGCGNAFVFTDGGPADNHVHFCAYCGHPLVPVLAASLEKGEL